MTQNIKILTLNGHEVYTPQVTGGSPFDHHSGNFGFGLLPWDKATFSSDMPQGCPHEDCILPG